MPITRPAESSAGGSSPGGPIEGMLPKKWPSLCEMLSDSTYSDGSARATATLLVFVEGGMVKLCLNDRDLGRTAWAAGTSLEAAMDAHEKRLAKGEVEWRASSQVGAKKGKGR